MNKPGKKDLHIVFEGITEERFLKRLEKLFDTNVNIIPENADGESKIWKKYKTVKKKNAYSETIVMYDLDGTKTIKDILDLFSEKGIKIPKKEIYFVNPKFELIFVLCKVGETPIDNYELHIKRHYGIEHYEKRNDQIKTMVSQLQKEHVIALLDRINRLLSSDDTSLRSTNYDKLLLDIYAIQ